MDEPASHGQLCNPEELRTDLLILPFGELLVDAFYHFVDKSRVKGVFYEEHSQDGTIFMCDNLIIGKYLENPEIEMTLRGGIKAKLTKILEIGMPSLALYFKHNGDDFNFIPGHDPAKAGKIPSNQFGTRFPLINRKY